MPRLKYYFSEIKDLGLKGSLYRIYYEFFLRSGLFEFLDKYKQGYIPDLIKIQWQKNIGNFFTPVSEKEITGFLNSLHSKEIKKIISIADKSLNGEILCFSKWYANYGKDINWHLNPLNGVVWPADKHWSKAMRFKNGGDIKLVWEINRFPHFYFLVRAFYLTKDSKYPHGFVRQIESWHDSNKYAFGVNWASGQETAIRLLSWIFAFFHFKNNYSFNQKFIKLFFKLIYDQTWIISRHIDYAYFAVGNNHLIGEALALYAVGILFPFLPDSSYWRKKGKKLLIYAAQHQFYPDGGYCQLSHTYHRLATHYYLWAIQIGRQNNDMFPEIITDILKNTADYFYQNMNSDGILANWGNNDGALLNPWTSCDYCDFRPVISAVYRITGQSSPLENGPWDEESLWLNIGSNSAQGTNFSQRSVSFKDSGIHILRKNNKNFCVFRCGTPPDRFGQADQLHLDIFWDGINVLCDGGSYLYNDQLHYHNFFMGTSSHNTINVNREDQMQLLRRFKWIYKAESELTDFNLKQKEIRGRHFGYERLEKGLIHSRSVKIINDYYVILDRIEKNEKNIFTFNLHWLLNARQADLTKINDELYSIISDGFYLYLSCPEKTDVGIVRGLDNNSEVDGWYSRYYGHKEPVFAVRCIVSSANSINFCTILSDKQLDKAEIQKCESY